MYKHDLINAIASDTGVTQKDVSKMLESFMKTVGNVLKEGDEITLINFGRFTAQVRKARTGRNPKTGEVIRIPETKTPRFIPGKGLREAIA